MTDTALVLTWLVFAHLLADFVLQNDWIAVSKGTGGRRGWEALAVHGLHVALCLVPAVLAFGLPGLAYLALVALSHVAVDRWKVQATRRAERSALETARRRLAATGEAPTSGLGSAWTPWPGMLFLADQALHLTIALLGWLILLQGVALQGVFVDVVNRVLRDWDRATVHAATLTGLVLLSLFLVNTRAAYYFVLALVSPREMPVTEPAVAGVEPEPVSAARAPSGYTVRMGPLVATVEPSIVGLGDPLAAAAASPAVPAGGSPGLARGGSPGRPHGATTIGGGGPNGGGSSGDGRGPGGNGAHDPGAGAAAERSPYHGPSVPSGAPARIGATIGALERLLIVAFVLGGAAAAVGFVIAAKTIARFRQLDDRGFAEYYLLGTLASVSVALGTALVAQAVLATIPS